MTEFPHKSTLSFSIISKIIELLTQILVRFRPVKQNLKCTPRQSMQTTTLLSKQKHLLMVQSINKEMGVSNDLREFRLHWSQFISPLSNIYLSNFQLILQFKNIRPILMYYYQNPLFYQFQGQVYLLPSILPLDVSQPSYFENKQTQSQEQKKPFQFKVEMVLPENNNIVNLEKLQEVKPRKDHIDSDYEPEKNQTLIFYKKKNTESNLSNQIYSYLSCDRSKNLMLKLFGGDGQKVQEFYKLVKKIKKSNKKYMNRSYIAELLQLNEESTNFKIYKRAKCPLKIQEVRKALRISLRYFLINICDLGLLTSKKMSKLTLMEHFARKREIMQFLFEKVATSNQMNN